jgi:hypothetical protein
MDMYTISERQVGWQAAFASKPAPTVNRHIRKIQVD